MYNSLKQRISSVDVVLLESQEYEKKSWDDRPRGSCSQYAGFWFRFYQCGHMSLGKGGHVNKTE